MSIDITTHAAAVAFGEVAPDVVLLGRHQTSPKRLRTLGARIMLTRIPMPSPHPVTQAQLLVLLIATACALFLITGCQAQSRSARKVERSFSVDDNGRPVYVETITQSGFATAPGPTSQPTIVAITDDGVESSASGEQVKQLGAYVSENRDKLIYGAAVLVLVFGVVCAVKFDRALGVTVASTGLGLFFIPVLIDRAGQYVVAGFVAMMAIVVAMVAAWCVAKLRTRFRVQHAETLSGVGSAMKLMREGKPAEAGAALRETPAAREAVASGLVSPPPAVPPGLDPRTQ